MPELFGRSLILKVDTLELSNLDCVFKVQKTLKPEPNTCDLKIYNLNESHRKQIEAKKKPAIELAAGYGNDLSVLYIGELRYGFSQTEGPSIATVLSSGDGEKEIQQARINVPIGPKTLPEVALRNIAKALGVGKGNLEDAIIKLRNGRAQIFGSATTLSGSAAREMTAFCRSAGLEWSIQNGKLQFLEIGEALKKKAIVLSSDTGLIESPTVDSKGILSATSLLNPEIRPGVRVDMRGKHVRGLYRIIQCEYTGDTRGNDWHVHLMGQKENVNKLQEAIFEAST